MGGSDSNVGPGRMVFQPPPINMLESEIKSKSHHPVEAPVGEVIQDKKD